MKDVTPIDLQKVAEKYPMTQADKDRFLAIKENANRLGNCKKHFFPNLPKEWHFNTKVHCPNCDGHMDLVNIHTYVCGYMAGGGAAPTDIVPEWFDALDPEGKFVDGSITGQQREQSNVS